jgi:serine/threonine protein kinase
MKPICASWAWTRTNTGTAAATSSPPPGPQELILADFLDEALERLARGEAVSVPQLLARTPELIQQGERLLANAQTLLEGREALAECARLLQSDLLSLEADEAPDPEPPPDSAPLPDPLPGEFRIRRRLGAGAFGTVWLADDLYLGRPVALKTVRPPAAPERAALWLRQLRAEARLLATLHHRNIVQVYAWREAPTGEHYLVLQYVPGGSLADRVGREGPLPWAPAARYVADVAEGLLAVHARDVVHRDVKPANILWDPEADEALLTDFGISVRIVECDTKGGTPFYMPPEAFEGVVSPAQDVYALAASLFWLTTGSVPFPGPTAADVKAQARRGLADPEPRFTVLPAPLEDLIRAGLAAEQARRPSLAEFVASLRGALNQLLADSLLVPGGPAAPAPVQVRLTVSRQADRYTFVPVATTRPVQSRLLRDIRHVPPEAERADVRTGDRLRIEAEADRAGYLTVFNIGPSGNLNLLLPHEPSHGLAAVEPGRPVPILDVELTPPAGRERLFALWTRAPLPLSREELRHVAERGELPVSGPYRATRDMTRVQEWVQNLGPQDRQAAVLELNHHAQ